MEEFLEKLGYWLQQAWVYIPAVLAFISAVGIPALVQIAKILAAARSYLSQNAKLKGKANETLEEVNKMAEALSSSLREEAEFLESLAATAYNKKQKAAIMERARKLRQRADGGFSKIERIAEEADPKNKRKVKVKVRVKGKDAENGTAQ